MGKERQSQIHVVTAYFDIGWHGRPGTVKRSNDWYITNFAKLAQLQNPMSIFTQDNFRPQVGEIRGQGHLAAWLAEAFIKTAMQLATKEGFTTTNEYVLAQLVREHPDKFNVLSLGKDNFFGALSVYNKWEDK